MDIDRESTSSQDGIRQYSNKKTVTWSTDTSIAMTTADLFSHLKDSQKKAANAGELDDSHSEYKTPQDKFVGVSKVNQRIHFNLNCHRGTSADIPTFKLFKSFTSTLKKLISF
jgi:adenosine deaminase